MSNWDDYQRWVCRFFGGQKGWKGDDDECYSLAGVFAPEAKLRKSLPKWIREGMEQAEAFARRAGKPYPILVLGYPGANRMKSIVCMRLEQFDWLMKEARLKPENYNGRTQQDTDQRHGPTE